MATTLTVTKLSRTAATALGTPGAGDVTGNLVPNGGTTFLYAECSSTPRTVSVAFERTVDGQAVTARSYSLGANFKGFLGPWPVSDYGQVVSVTPSHAEVLLKAFSV